VAAGRLVRCPECKTPFTITTTLAIDNPVTTPAPPPAPAPLAAEISAVHRTPGMSVISPLFLLAVTGAILIGFGLVAGALLVVRDRPTPAAPELVEKPTRDTTEDERLAAERKRLQEDRDRLDRDRRKLEASGYLRDGKEALGKKDYTTAEKAFNNALKVGSDDADIKAAALAGLVEVRSALDSLKRNQDDETKRKEQIARLLTQARKDLSDKQLAAAVLGFESALALAPDDQGIRKELLAARAIVEADQAEKKKLAEYQDHMTAGRAHLVAQRFQDALREFLAALRVVPGDVQATQGQRAAEAGLKAPVVARNNDVEFQDRLARSRRAVTDRRFQEAIDLADSALRLIPGNEEGRKQLQAARDAQKEAKALFDPLMTQAKAALAINNFPVAFKLFSDASRLMPEDSEATRGMDAARSGADAVALAQVNYQRLMNQGAAALSSRNYADAVVAFTAALQLVPGDADATRGLRDANAGVARRAQRKLDIAAAVQAGNSAMTARRFTDAVKSFTTAVNLDPDNSNLAALLSNARYNMFMQAGQKATFANQKSDAIKAFQAALNEKPNDPAATAALQSAQTPRKGK
jgi:tetratricopeptide (TPR) repeat protein